MFRTAKNTWHPSPPAPARPACTTCHGTGWKLGNRGGAAQGGRCSCRPPYRLGKKRGEVGVSRRYEHCTLDIFRPQTVSQARALIEARRFAERFPGVERGLYLAGGPGVGKTH